jgi:hypothetical protein
MDSEIEKWKGRASFVFASCGVGGLELLAKVDRANADIRYRRGEMDLALMGINRARAAELLIEQVQPARPESEHGIGEK